MSKLDFFKTNDVFTNYIKSIGFICRYVNSDYRYFTNNKGNQIRIDYENNIITLLNNKGYIVNYSTTFTNQQIEFFAKNDN